VSGSGWEVMAIAVVALVVVRRIAGGKRVSPTEVLEKIKAGAKIVDVRTPAEFRGGAYPGAVNIPVQELDRRAGELEKDQPVVVYCASGMRSASAERLLRAKGFVEVVNGGGLNQMPR
jgi:phage shock protein E